MLCTPSLTVPAGKEDLEYVCRKIESQECTTVENRIIGSSLLVNSFQRTNQFGSWRYLVPKGKLKLVIYIT